MLRFLVLLVSLGMLADARTGGFGWGALLFAVASLFMLMSADERP